MKHALLIFILSLSVSARASYERFEQNGKVGLRDDQGKVILPPSFDALGWSDGRFTLVGEITGYRKDNRWGLLNLRKTLITPPLYESLTAPGGDRIIASKKINPYTTKYGCLDLEGKLVIPFQYDEIVLQGLHAIVRNKEGARYLYGLIDINDRSVIPMTYGRIVPLGSLRYAVTNFEGKTALCSESGDWITPFVIDSISSFQNDLAVFHQGWKKGLIDRQGQIRIQPQYRDIVVESQLQAKVRSADEWTVRKEDFQVLRKLEADELHLLPQGYGTIRLGGKMGLVDEAFSTLIPPDYDDLVLSPRKLILARKNDKYGLLHLDQQIILPIQFDSLRPEGHLLRALHAGEWKLYDTVGVVKTESWFERMEKFNGTFFPVRQRGYWGGIDRWGHTRIACVYDTIFEFTDGLCRVQFQGHQGIIDSEDRWVITPRTNDMRLINSSRYFVRQDSTWFMKDMEGNIIYFSAHLPEVRSGHLEERLPDGSTRIINFQGQITAPERTSIIQAEEVFAESEGFTRIRRHNKYGFVDNRGRLRIANRYEAARDFHEGLAGVQLLGKWGFIDLSEQIVIQPTFNRIGDFRHGMAEVSRAGKVGLITPAGTVALEMRYDSVQRLEGHFKLYLNGLQGLADQHGRVLIEPRFDDLRIISQNRVIVKQRGRFGILTIDGLSIIPIDYQMMEFDQERKLFLVHEKKEWVTVEVK